MSYKIGEIGHVVFFGAQEYDNPLTLKKKIYCFSTKLQWITGFWKVMLAPVLRHQTENFMHLSQLQGQILWAFKIQQEHIHSVTVNKMDPKVSLVETLIMHEMCKTAQDLSKSWVRNSLLISQMSVVAECSTIS